MALSNITDRAAESLKQYTPNVVMRSIKSIRRRIRAMMPPPPRMSDDWSISMYQGSSPFCLAPANPKQNPVLTSKDITDIPARYVADPFMLMIDGIWHMFFEVMNKRSNKGEIGCATSRDGLQWNYQGIVLVEPFHLSYPYVFEWQGELFMIPETCQANSIRLYKADPFPFRWSFLTTLVAGREYADASLARFRDRWWLFAATGSDPWRTENLHVLFSDDLLGSWQEHPRSPVVDRNRLIARPGGRMLCFQNRLFRYTQDCAQTYGRQVRAFEVTELTTEHYAERLVSEEPILKPGKYGWNQMGMHHIDPHQLPDGNWLACVDGWRWTKAES